MNSDAAVSLQRKPVQCFVGASMATKIGLIAAVCSLVMLDGVNGAVFAALGTYLRGSFAVTADQITWAGIFYFVGKLYMLLLAARLQERCGQRWSFLTASMVLVLTTGAGALVNNYPLLLLVLLFQGASGGAMIALGQGVLLSTFPRREQPLVQAAYALAAVMFPATIVPVLLGMSAYHFYWQDVYVWMLPLGVLGCGWLVWKRRSLCDYVLSTPVLMVRILLMVTALFAIVYVLQQGNRNRWLEYPPVVWALLLAAVCILSFAFIETRGGPTYLRYSAFRYANFTFGTAVVVVAGISLFGSGFAISGFAAGVLNYPVSTSGLVQLSGSVLSVLSFVSVGLVIRFTKISPVLFNLFGLLLFATSMWNLGYAPSNVNFERFASWIVVRGFAFGCQFIPLTLLALTAVPRQDDVAAAGIFNFHRQLGALIGIAWLQTLREHLIDRNQTIFGNVFSSTSPNTLDYARAAQQALSLYGAQPWQARSAAMELTLREAQRQWTSIAYNGCFESLALVFLFCFPLVALVRILTARFLNPPAPP